MRRRPGRLAVLILVLGLALAGCKATPDPSPSGSPGDVGPPGSYQRIPAADSSPGPSATNR